jgi:hypothetical protein
LSCCKRKAKAALARPQRLENIGAVYNSRLISRNDCEISSRV